MICSMTGFAAKQIELPYGVITIELRAVNHRYLDIHLRLPEDFHGYEALIRDALAGKFIRGKIECRLALHQQEGTSSALQLNHPFLQQLIALGNEVKHYTPHANDLSVAELLKWPGVLTNQKIQSDQLQQPILALLQSALAALLSSRQREGEKLAALLTGQVEKMRALLRDILPRLPMIINQYHTKLNQRLSAVLHPIDDERIQQEILVFAQKIDIEEELDRLETHLNEVQRILQNQESGVGKRLDFLMQELNRETNTLGAKSASVETSQTAIALKVLIEQMREQIQNIE